MSLSSSTWEPVLDAAGVYTDNERARLDRALSRAADLLSRLFRGRLHSVRAMFHGYSIEERRLPLAVEAPLNSDEEAVDLEHELAHLVLGPVFRETRVNMPVEILQPRAAGSPPPAGPGLLYPID